MIRPAWTILGVISTFIISMTYFFYFPEHVESQFYITIYALIFYYTTHAILTDKSTYLLRNWTQALKKSLWKWLFWLCALSAVIKIYEFHPYYQNYFPQTRYFLEHFLKISLYLGLPYAFLSEKLRHSVVNFYHDPTLRFLSLFKLILRGHFRLAGYRILRGRYRHFWGSSFLRIHFLPIMVEGLHSLNKELFESLYYRANWSSATFIVALLTAFAWTADTNNASVGYFWESNFTKTKFKNVDPFPLHWIITLSCYAPFNNFMNTFIPSPLDHTRTDFLFETATFQIGTDFMIMVLGLGYMFSGTTLAFSWSNLGYKQIQTKGIYSVIRHPGTFFKLGFFFVMIFRYQSAYTFANILAYAGWTTIYILRTFCEERFLCKYPDYVEYKKKTKYRVIPWVW